MQSPIQSSPRQTCLIGVCGGSCSGKTSVCERIKNELGDSNGIVCLVSQDDYYKGASENYDIPSAIDFDLLGDNLEKLINGEEIDSPVYDYATHSRKSETKKVGPAKIIIVEGILIFCNERVRNLCNLKVFVEADEILCYTRRLERDTRERGRLYGEVVDYYMKYVVPSFRNYINPSRFYADISLINNTYGKIIGSEILIDHIKQRISKLLL